MPASAQTFRTADTLRFTGADTLSLRNPSPVPFSDSVQWLSDQPEGVSLRIEYSTGQVWLSRPAAAVLILHYRCWTSAPPPRIAIRSAPRPDSLAPEAYPDVFLEASPRSPVWDPGGSLTKSGSLTRGLTVGNNRSASVTSGLRLQIEGDLGDGLKVAGAVTDDNLPVQPDGTTQQLSDFDRVFLRVSKDGIGVTLGDFEISRKGSAFASYYRNVQGLQATYDRKETRLWLSGAVAKGKFHTNTLTPIDGVSGPYRLTGKNGERLFIVLAGSERVYLNGALLQRGENLDYVINYNTAEITFTARHVIANISRIVVDFEYNDRYFNRSLVVAGLEQELLGGRVKIQASYARDADNPRAPFDDPEAFFAVRDTLRSIGDALSQARTSGVFEAGYDPGEVRYARRDTLIGGILYERYLRSRDPAQAIYAIRFSFVGPGAGFYEPDPGDNENVFRWVPPDAAGKPAGTYAPVRSWVLPRNLQVADLIADARLSRYLRLRSEWALSSDDLNRLSPLDDQDNLGLAQRSSLVLERLPAGDSSWIDAEASVQTVSRRYTNLDRVYRAEYGRYWNFDESEPRRDEQIAQARVQYQYRSRLSLQAETGVRNTGPGRLNVRQVYTLNSRMPWMLQGTLTYTRLHSRNDSAAARSRWNRYEGEVFAPVRFLRPGMTLWIEDREERLRDSLRAGSFAFYDLKPYLRTHDLKTVQAEISANWRLDQEWAAGMQRPKSEAWTWQARGQFRPSPALNLQGTAAWRSLRPLDSAFAAGGLVPSKTFNTNLQASVAPRSRLVYFNALYEVSSERIARREIRYVEVMPGQGEYVWLDSLFNRDGVQDIEEFQLANNPLLGNFIRITLPSRELFPTTRSSLSGTLRWEFSQVIGQRKGLPGLLRQTRIQTVFRLNQNRSQSAAAPAQFPNPFRPFADTALLDAAYTLRQELTLFQNDPVGDIRWIYQDQSAKLFLTTGEELRSWRYHTFQQRLNLGENKSLELETRAGSKRTLAPEVPVRNFHIRFVETQPQFNLQAGRQLRVSAAYAYKFRRTVPDPAQPQVRLHAHKLILDGRWNIADRNNLFVRMELAQLGEQGEAGPSALYELREGLQPGLNAIWQGVLSYYLLENLELSLTYDGRIARQAPPLHTGRVQIRALF
ncbi:MAG: hypothetical protein NW241_22960 [Bacteroidia bacterium]|nr:hypothetical protein [Bacteroidia bacterium]